MGHLYYDVTDLVDYARHYDTLSGIQRVSVRLAQQIVAQHGTSAIRLLRWRRTWRGWRGFDAGIFAPDLDYDRSAFCAWFGTEATGPGCPVSLGEYLHRRYRGMARHWQRVRLPVSNLLNRGNTYAKRGIGRPSRNHPSTKGVTVHFGPGDRILLPGALWGYRDYHAFLEAAAQQGAEVIPIVYDLIPILFPEHVDDRAPVDLATWIMRMTGFVAAFITISQATKKDLEAFVAEHDLASRPIHAIPLAHEFAGAQRAATQELDEPRQEPLRRSAAQAAASNSGIRPLVLNAARLPYMLFVGTIESRKNIYLLGRAFEQLAERFGIEMPRLIMAGKPGWLRSDFEHLLRATGYVKGLIQIVKQPNDAELAYLYENCLFLVCPSYYEGWGLPIGEALWYGRPVVASNTSSMPEVGGDLVRYFDPYDLANMIDVIGSFIEDAEAREDHAARARQARQAGRLRRWSDVADDVWRVVHDGAAKPDRS